jgi:hypothetical protein
MSARETYSRAPEGHSVNDLKLQFDGGGPLRIRTLLLSRIAKAAPNR